MNNQKNARELLKQAHLYTDNQPYTVVHLPNNATIAAASICAQVNAPFLALLADKDEVSLIIPTDVWDVMQSRLLEATATHDWRLITLDVVLPYDAVGVLAGLGTALAEANVPFLALSAYERDHLLVQQPHFPTAWEVLTKCIE